MEQTDRIEQLESRVSRLEKAMLGSYEIFAETREVLRSMVAVSRELNRGMAEINPNWNMSEYERGLKICQELRDIANGTKDYNKWPK